MKLITTNLLTKVAVLLLGGLFLQSCSLIRTVSPKEKMLAVHKAKVQSPVKYENFDRKPISKESFVIANMIAVVQPELQEKERNKVASQISIASKKFKIEPQIIVAIIDTESNFHADKVSSTGDVSVAQINVEVWNKEFIRMKKPPMIKGRIKMDQEYALMKMVEILNIIKTRYGKKDRRWYARYHSNTNKYKKDYLHKLEIRMKLLASTPHLTTRKLALANEHHLKKLSNI